MGVNNISGAEILMKKLDTNGDGRVDKNDKLNEQIQKELGLNEGKSYTKENIENVSDKLAKLGVEVENLTQNAEKPQMGISQEGGWYEVQPALEMHTTGDIYAERLPDGTSLQYDFKEKTVTKYDADGNVMFEMSIQEYENQKIEDKIKNLKSGESMQYEERQSISAPGISSSERNTVNVTRKENGELVETRAGVLHRVGFPSMQGVRLNTTYDENHENKISEDFVDPQKSQWGVVSTKHFENGKEKSVVTNLSNMDEYVDTLSILKALSLSNKYSQQQLKDSDGKVVLTVEDGKFYKVKANGEKCDKAIDDGKAWDIIQKLRDKNELGELTQEY